MQTLPRGRNRDIVINELDGELLIYDLASNKALCLNDISAKVFSACDGRQTIDDLKRKHQLTDEIIYLALDRLKKENLLESNYVSPYAGLSRREVMRRVGLASLVALPIISVLVAPTAVAAASVGGVCTCGAPVNANARLEGCPCGSNDDCCGVCLANGGAPVCSAPTIAAQPTADACCPSILV